MNVNLQFTLHSYWHIGSGLEGGAYADALALKNAQQLPYIPGKSIKGLLRDAFERAHKNNWFTELQLTINDENISWVGLLFGYENTAGTFSQGLLQISNAVLSEQEISFLNEQPQAISQLYKVTYSTAIDEITGVAQNTSLRSMEVCVPMTLTAQVSLNTSHSAYLENEHILQANFLTIISQVTSLVSELGAKRHRGLGNVTVTATLSHNAKQEQ